MEIDVEQFGQPLVELISQWGLKVLGALALLLVGRVACGWLRRTTRRGLERTSVDDALVPFISSIVYYLALTALLLAVLSLFGIQTTSLIAVLGAASLAVGLALQGTLSNFAAGTMLLLFRPFRIGDWVEVAGSAGSVREIGLFSTVLNTGDNVRITLPNASVYGNVIKNYSANETRRIDLLVGVSYGDDLAQATEAVRKVLADEPRVLEDPAPTVAVAELGDSSVNLVVRPWCATGDYWPLRFEITRRVKESLEAAGCSIPFPQRDVHVVETPSAD
jgi:small conductance mechanosensitive channel